METGLTPIEESKLHNILIRLCGIILTEQEMVSESQIDWFLDSLTSDEIKALNHASTIKDTTQDLPTLRLTVQDCIMSYIQNFQDRDETVLFYPFEFDSGNGFSDFIKAFDRKYGAKYNDHPVPEVFHIAFRCIQRISEQYLYFEQFYAILSQQTQDSFLSIATNIVQDTTTRLVNDAIKDSVSDMTEQSVEKAVEDKMTSVNRQVSETTVTVLGIFSAIVLTIVGGFIYSASVVSSANETNYFKLASITSLVGLVCFNLLILMFHYIFRIKGSATEITKNWIVILANIILILVMIVSGALYFFVPVPKDGIYSDSLTTESVIEVQCTSTTEDDETATENSNLYLSPSEASEAPTN